MIIFLYGPDTYRLQQKVKEIEEYCFQIHRKNLNLKKIDAFQGEFRIFWQEFSQRAIFTRKKLFFLENLFANQKFKTEFFKKIEKISQSPNIVVLIEKKEISPNEEFFLKLKKVAKIQKFPLLEGKTLKQWLKNNFQSYQVEIEERALEKLIEFCGNDTWWLAQEIKKLAAFCRNFETRIQPKIKVKDIETMVRPKIETDIFQTVECLARKDKREALKLIIKHLEKGDHPLYLLKMISFQFRNLIVIKSQIIFGNFNYSARMKTVKELKLHPFVIKKSLSLAQHFSFSELKEIYEKIFKTELKIKTGQVSPASGLLMLVSEI